MKRPDAKVMIDKQLSDVAGKSDFFLFLFLLMNRQNISLGSG